MSIKYYEDKIRCLEYEKNILEQSRDRVCLLASKLQAENELLERKIKKLNEESDKKHSPKFYAKMSISKCV